MVKYWPSKPSIDLNNSVVDLFIVTNNKLKHQLYNTTHYHLYLDILDQKTKYQLLKTVLNELKILLLDITALNLTIKDLHQLQYKLLCNFISKNLQRFVQTIDISNKQLSHTKIEVYHYSLLDKNLMIEPLLIYLLFGSSSIDYSLFIFNADNTPTEHVIILFENFMIQVSNLVIYHIINNIKSLPDIVLFLQKYKLCNRSYLSIRSIALFLNQLLWQNILFFLYLSPKSNL